MSHSRSLPFATRPLHDAELRTVRRALAGSEQGAGWTAPLLDAAVARDVHPGETLLEQDAPVAELLVVLEGLVEVRRSGELVDHVGVGELLGGRGAKGRSVNESAVVAVTGGAVAVLPAHDALRARRRRPRLQERFSERAARQHDEAV